MIKLRHMDLRHFIIIECRHEANGCTTQCGCIGLILYRYLSCLGAIICDINSIGFVPVCMHSRPRFSCKLCNSSLVVHESKWTTHVKWESDVAQSYTGSNFHYVNRYAIRHK